MTTAKALSFELDEAFLPLVHDDGTMGSWRNEPTYVDPVLPAYLFVGGEGTGSSLMAPASDRSSSIHEGGSQVDPPNAQPSRAEQLARRVGEELPEAGAIIDKYRIEELIGTGGFAAVYRATHLLLHMPVAIKLLRPKIVKKKPGLASLLYEEARFAARINHPNVVHVYDVTHTAAITYVVLEFIDGQSLADRIGQGPMPVAEVLKVGLDVAEGLKAGLEQELIHRDIKPANVLIDKKGTAKIVDLGLATPSDAGSGGTEHIARTAVVGTPCYMAPEQATNPEHTDFKADIYSLGVTLYHALCGRPPFVARNAEGYLAMHKNEPVPPPTHFVADTPPAFSKLLLRMLAKNPRERPSSYDELTQELRELLDGL